MAKNNENAVLFDDERETRNNLLDSVRGLEPVTPEELKEHLEPFGLTPEILTPEERVEVERDIVALRMGGEVDDTYVNAHSAELQARMRG